MTRNWAVILLASLTLTASPADIAGTWKLRFAGPIQTAPKTIGSMVLDLKVDGTVVTGTAHIGSWPGDAPITDGKIEGDRITFTATGHLTSTTGIPTCLFEATVHGDEMLLTLRAIHNSGGPLGNGNPFQYTGARQTN